MSDIKRSVAIGALWITIVWAVCFSAVALFPSLTTRSIEVALHMQVNSPLQNTLTVRSFIAGLIWWNVTAFFGVGLFKLLDASIKAQRPKVADTAGTRR
ncbi:MAG TPA: DUF5676 family membrane protein [Candidatus Acidoferrales bacterium]|nr:DUF5676 family membrane protein [Candidatus Acidoferrales bacterium]